LYSDIIREVVAGFEVMVEPQGTVGMAGDVGKNIVPGNFHPPIGDIPGMDQENIIDLHKAADNHGAGQTIKITTSNQSHKNLLVAWTTDMVPASFPTVL